MKQDDFGRANWKADGDQDVMQEFVEVVAKEQKKFITPDEEKKAQGENHVDDSIVEYGKKKEEEEEDNKMTLDQYEKILEQKRKALAASKAKERKVEVDKAFETMQMVDKKSTQEDVFIKLNVYKEKNKKK